MGTCERKESDELLLLRALLQGLAEVVLAVISGATVS